MNSSHMLSLPNSGDTFYFRKYIPADLIEHFQIQNVKIYIPNFNNSKISDHKNYYGSLEERIKYERENLLYEWYINFIRNHPLLCLSSSFIKGMIVGGVIVFLNFQ